MHTQNNKLSRSNYKKIGASFFAMVLILTMMPAIIFSAAPATSAQAAQILPPVADAGGPYEGYTDEIITLDGSGSSGDIVEYAWDWDGDGSYDVVSPITGIVDFNGLPYGTYTSVLRVTGPTGLIDTDSTTLTVYQENPELSSSCGVDIALVLDSSGSIDNSNLNIMKTAFEGFVDAFLPNTPTLFSVTDFDGTAVVLQDFTSNIADIKNAINTPTSGGTTNWEDGLVKAYSTFDPRIDKPDMIIFASDGNPNTDNGGSGTPLEEAIEDANIIKADGIRIITLGIGSGPDANNLKAISSPDAYYDSDFETLADTLADIAGELCGGTITVRKLVDGTPMENWEYTASVDGGVATPTSGLTDANGYLVFEIELNEGVEEALVDIVETPQNGYNFVDAKAYDEGVLVGTPGSYRIDDIPVGSNSQIYAPFNNTEQSDDCPPTTTKSFCGPYYGEEHYWVTLATEITLTAVDCPQETASGIDYIHYEIWWDSDEDGKIDEAYDTKVADEDVYEDSVTFQFTEECLHAIKWYAVDLAGNIEQTHYQEHRVDNSFPEQTVEFDAPILENFHERDGELYPMVGLNTPIYLHSDDTWNGTKACAVGSEFLTYEVWWGEEFGVWDHYYPPVTVYDGDPEDLNPEDGKITVEVFMLESCWHEIHYNCQDLLGNQGLDQFVDFVVDGDAPLSTWEYIGTQMYVGNEHYITNKTIKRVNATDIGCIPDGSGVEYIYWKVDKITDMGLLTIAEGYRYDDSDFVTGDDPDGPVVVTEDSNPVHGKMSIDFMVDDHCEHYIYHQAVDYMGNKGPVIKQKVRIDKKPPVTTKTIGTPSYDMGFWVTTDTLFELDAVDQEEPCMVGVKEIHYRIGWDENEDGVFDEDEFYPWVVVPGDHAEFTFQEECYHKIEWYAVDNFGNVEELHEQWHKVDNTPPNTTKTIGDPKYEDGQGMIWVRTDTMFELDAVDLPPDCPSGVEQICYRIGWDEDENGVVEEDEFYDWVCIQADHAEFYMPEECYHKLEWYSVDNLGHVEETHEQWHRVDDTPPVTTKTFDGPTCGQDNYYLTNSTMITLTAVDGDEPCAVGVDYIHYEIWWDSDNDGQVDTKLVDEDVYDDTVTFAFTEECLHEIRWYAVDLLGNMEEEHTQQHRVDDSAPETVKTFSGPTYGEDNYWVTTETEITLTATDLPDNDCAVWGVTIYYEIWWDSDNDSQVDTKLVDENVNDDTVTFAFTEECLHEIRWYAVDCLGNTEELHTQQHRVDDTPPTTTKTFNGPTCGDSDYYLTNDTEITLIAVDGDDPCDVGIDYIYYEIYWDSDNDGVAYGDTLKDFDTVYDDEVTIQFTEECLHLLRWYAVDNLGNTEEINEQWHRVDDSAPITTKTIGTPQCEGPTGVNGFYVTNDTLIELDAVDTEKPCAVGVTEIHYRIGWDENKDDVFDENEFYPWQTVPGDHAEFKFQEECYHKLEWYAVDCLGNTEDTQEQYHRVDDSAPETVKTFEGPTYLDNYWLTTDTEITLTATDKEEPCAVGGVTLYWEVWHDTDGDGTVDTEVNVDVIDEDEDFVTFRFLEDCLHEIRWYAVDCLGNTEETHTQQHRVDNQPPKTLKSFDGPTKDADLWEIDHYNIKPEDVENYWLQDHGTTIILDATDMKNPCDVGIDYIHVELWYYNFTSQQWEEIFNKDIDGDHFEFTIDEDCLHEIRWYAVDHLGNMERMHYQQHRVDSQAPETTKTFEGPVCAATQEDIDKFELTTQEEIDNFWLRDHDTWVCLKSYDMMDPCIVGVDYLEVELYLSTDEGETWTNLWTKTIYDGDENDDDVDPGQVRYKFQIDEDCLHKIVWHAVDYLTNTEETHVQYHRVDSQAPESFKTFEGPTYPAEDYPNEMYGPDSGENYWVTSDTVINLTAEDLEAPCDVGVVSFNVMVEWDPECSGEYMTIFDEAIEAPYHYSFTFKELVEIYQGDEPIQCGEEIPTMMCEQDCYEGRYRITWSAEDCLGNIEEPKLQYHQVDDTPPHVIILKPTNGWYSDGTAIPTVVFSEDLPNIVHCNQMNCGAVGIEEDKQGQAWLVDIFPDFDIVELDTTNLLYNQTSHEYIGNAVVPFESGLPDGIVLFVAGSEDNLGNGWNSLFELIHWYAVQAMTEYEAHGYDTPMLYFMATLSDFLADFVADQNIVFVGIDNTAPEVEILDTNVEVGTIYLKANATDALSGIENGAPMNVKLGGINIGTLPYDKTIGGCEGTLPTAGAPDGLQTLQVCVADHAGSTGCDEEQVYVTDLPGPTTSGTEATPPSVPIGDEITITATVHSTIAKIAGAEYYIDTKGDDGMGTPMLPVDGVWDQTSEDVIITINTTDWVNNYYTVYVHGLDEDGRWGAYDEEEFSVVDPASWRDIHVHIVTPGQGDVFTVDGCENKYLTVNVDAYHIPEPGLPKDHDVDVELHVGPFGGLGREIYETTFDGTYFSADIDLFKYQSNGQPAMLEITAVARDTNLVMAEYYIIINVHTTVDYDAWLTSGWNGPADFDIPSYMDGKTVEQVFASVVGDIECVVEEETLNNYKFGEMGNTLSVIDTSKTYWVYMHNSSRFYTDTNAPEVVITYPDDGLVLYNEGLQDLIQGTVCEIETSVDEVTITIYDENMSEYWDGTHWTETETMLPCDGVEMWSYPGSYDIDYTYRSGHTLTVTAYATDLAGNTGTDSVWYMFIDDIDPNVEILYPVDEETYNSCCGEPYEITGTASDDETIVTEVYITIKDQTTGNWWTGTDWNGETQLPCDYDQMAETWEYQDVPEWTDGHDYTVYATAVDAAGNTGTTSAFFSCICGSGDCDPDKTYTTTADFNEGTMLGTVAENDQLMLETEGVSSFPTLWIANAGEDSLSKWDTSTNKEVARYHTWFGPLANHGSWEGPAPSRTCVDSDGNCYVANRHFDSDKPANVIKILTNDWIDRNGNGVMDTSYDANSDGTITADEMLPMTDSNSNGVIDDDEIVDERIAWVATVGASNGLGRSLAIDRDGNIWLGLFNTREYYKLDGDDGSVLGGPYSVGSHSPYGGLVDKYGYLWGSSLSSNILKMNTADPTDYETYYVPSTYGIALGYDSSENTLVYVGGNYPYVVFNSSSETYTSPGYSFDYTRGVATDSEGNIVAGSNSDGSVIKYDSDNNMVWEVSGQVVSEVRGIVVDSDDNIWCVHRGSSKLCKYDGTNGDPLGIYDSGLFPYTYSDATGIGYSSSVNSGKWTGTHDSQAAGTMWNTVSWNSDEPEQTTINVKVRSSDDGVTWSPWETATNGDTLSSTPDNRYVQVEVTMQSDSETSPIIYDLTIDGTCAGEPENNPPVITIDNPENMHTFCMDDYESIFINGQAYDAETFVDCTNVSVALYYDDGTGTNHYYDGGVWSSSPYYHSVDCDSGSGTDSDPLLWELTLAPPSNIIVTGRTYYINAVCYDETGLSDATTHNIVFENCDE